MRNMKMLAKTQDYQNYIENLFFNQIKRLTLSTKGYIKKEEKSIEKLFNIELL